MTAVGTIQSPTKRLRVGTSLKHPVHDPGGTLLLSAGAIITDRVKTQLLSRGIDLVVLHASDCRTAEMVTAAVEARVDELCESVSYEVSNGGAPLSDQLNAAGCRPYSSAQRGRLAKQFEASKQVIGGTMQAAFEGEPQSSEPLSELASNTIQEITEDIDQVVASSEEFNRSPEIAERSLRLATLGMAIAARMGFSEADTREVGLCGLIHDWGVYAMPNRPRRENETYNAAEWDQFLKHPFATMDMLEGVSGLSDEVRLSAYQVHEQMDGSGYPRGLGGDEIHPFARILNVADNYLFLTSPFQGRPSFVPYDVMVYLLNHTKRGRFDSEVTRALLGVQSVFPLGSRVRLTDGTEATVTRANGGNHTQPIVQLGGSSADDQLVDLSTTGLTVEAALPNPDRNEMRLGRDLMEDVIWQGPNV